MNKFQLLNRLLNQNASYPYQTNLSDEDKIKFASWANENNVPVNLGAKSDYDMQGFYKDPNAESSINPLDNQMHFSDKYKTPYHQSFSNESKYATEDAPAWNNNLLENDNSIGIETPMGFEKIKKFLK